MGRTLRAMVAATVGALALVALTAAPVSAATLDDAAAALRHDPVFVDPGAEQAISATDVDRLRQAITRGNEPVFVAVLPATAAAEAGSADALPESLRQRTGLAGTYAVLAGNSFRVASNTRSDAAARATSAFQRHRNEGPAAVLLAFVDGLEGSASGTSSGSGSGGGWSLGWLLVLLAAGAGGAFLLIRRSQGRRQAAEEVAGAVAVLRSRLQVLANDVLALEPQVALHDEARTDYEAAVARYQAAEGVLDQIRTDGDVARVGRLVAEAEYAMACSRAVLGDRPRPEPPAELQAPGPHEEPPVVIERGVPEYRGYGGGGWYSGGWFGGGGLLPGILLGTILNGGWGGGWGAGNAGGGLGGGDFGGGLGGGDFGGGGGGGVGGGDF